MRPKSVIAASVAATLLGFSGQHSSPNQALHLTGAAILVSRGSTSHRRPRQVSWVVRRTKPTLPWLQRAGRDYALSRWFGQLG